MSFLRKILAIKREEVRQAKRRMPEAALLALPRPPRRDFAGRLRRGGLAVIAEVKRASPSRGLLAPALDLPRLVSQYEEGGAAAISVLTDREFFHGSPQDLEDARQATGLPLLRKDFLIDPYQLIETDRHGADAVLLIVACLGRSQLREMLSAARELSLAVLLEVHDEAELDHAAAVGAAIVGINNRDLRTFRVDPATTHRLLPRVPKGTLVVAESGIRGPEDAATLARAGVDAILVGESLVTSADPAAALRALREAGEGVHQDLRPDQCG